MGASGKAAGAAVEIEPNMLGTALPCVLVLIYTGLADRGRVHGVPAWFV